MDYIFGLFRYFPYRCKECGARFFVFRPKPPKIEEKPASSTETEIRATRDVRERQQKRREYLLYGFALLCFIVFLYFITRPAGPSPDGN